MKTRERACKYYICEDDYDSLEDFNTAIEEMSEEYYAESWGHWEEVSEEEYCKHQEYMEGL